MMDQRITPDSHQMALISKRRTPSLGPRLVEPPSDVEWRVAGDGAGREAQPKRGESSESRATLTHKCRACGVELEGF